MSDRKGLKGRVYKALLKTPGMETLGIARKIGVSVRDVQGALDELVRDGRLFYAHPDRETVNFVKRLRYDRKKHPLV
jgi:hypothetical protein